MAFGDGVWSASVTGSVFSQAPAGLLWEGLHEELGGEAGVGGGRWL